MLRRLMAGSPRCTAGRRLQDREPGDVRCFLGLKPPPLPRSADPGLDGGPKKKGRSPRCDVPRQDGVRDAGHVDGGGSSPTPASCSCLGSVRWTSCCLHAGPANDDAWLSQDQARHSLHGLPEPDGAAWVEIGSSSPPTAACCPASAPQLWHPSQGGVPRGKGADLRPQVGRAKHTIDGLLELDDVRDAACVDGGGSSSPTAASCLASKPQLWRPPSHAGVPRGIGACLLPQARAVHTLDALPELNDVLDATCVGGVSSSAPPVASCLASTPQLWCPSGARVPPGKDAWLLPQARVQHTLHVLAEPDGRRRPTSVSCFQLAPDQLCSHSLADKPHARAAPTMFSTPPCSHTLIRSYSTSSVPPTTFLSLERPNPLIKVKPFRVTVGDPELLLKQVKSDHSSYLQELRDDDLKSEYFRSVRPFLLACCLVCSPDHLKGQDAGLLYSNNEHFISKDPNYLTSLDLMRKLKVYHQDNWGHLLNFIRDNRVMIVECWETSLGSIEVFVYDHGLSGPPGDAQYYRGQSDASIKSNKGNGLNDNEKYASLCTLIWKGYQVKDCQVFHGVRCSSKINRAEMLAMFALVRRGVERSIKKFSVITDDQEVDRNNRGVGPLEIKTNDSDVRMATRYLIGRYESFISRWENRVKNMFPDSILKEDELRVGDRNMELLLEKWGHHLSGLPLFKIHQSQEKIKNQIIGASTKGLRQFGRQWKLDVKSEDAKFEALMNLIQSLSPPFAVVHVKDKHCAYLIKDHAPQILKRYEYKVTVYKVKHGYTVTLIQGLLSPGTKHLRVMYDASVWVPDLEVGNGLKVTFLTPEDEQSVCYKGVPEVSSICLLFFGTYDRRYKVEWN